MLDVAVEYPQDLASLTLDYLEELMNREGHGLTCDQLVEVIDNLSRRELLSFLWVNPASMSRLSLTKRQLEKS